VKGDAVDEMFAGYLNKAKLTIEVQRISASNYMFGTKKILAKIINGRLVIRVGGGYMNAEEFIEQYGKIEMMKMLKMEESKGGYDTEQTDGRPTPASGLASARLTHSNTATPGRRMTTLGSNKMMDAMGNAMKEKMRQQLQQVKAYDTQTVKTRQTTKPGGLNDRSLGSSARQRGTLNKLNSTNNGTADEKARHKESIGQLANALSAIQTGYRSNQNVESPALGGGAGTARKGKAKPKMDSLTVEPQGPLSARGGSKSPSSGPASGLGSATPGTTSGGSKIGQGSRRASHFPSFTKAKDLTER